jgi:hypothetical protein
VSLRFKGFFKIGILEKPHILSKKGNPGVGVPERML